LDDLQQLALIMAAVPAHTPEADHFARQCTADESGLAILDDALTSRGQRRDGALFRL